MLIFSEVILAIMHLILGSIFLRSKHDNFIWMTYFQSIFICRITHSIKLTIFGLFILFSTNSVFTLQASSFHCTSIYSVSSTEVVLLDQIYTVFNTELVLLPIYSVFSTELVLLPFNSVFSIEEVFQLGAARYLWKTVRVMLYCKQDRTCKL